MSILIYLFLAYLLYQIIFRFVIPIWRTTRQVKRGFRDMQERMNTHMNGGQPQPPQQPNVSSAATKPAQPSDYIDFEEVKE